VEFSNNSNLVPKIDSYRLNPMNPNAFPAKSAGGIDDRFEYAKCHELGEKHNIETLIRFVNPTDGEQLDTDIIQFSERQL